MRTVFFAAATAIVCLAPTGASAQDVAAGENLFKRCMACHAVGEGARNKVGPVLNDVFGRQAGALEGYNYSQAMVEAGEGGLVWTEETVSAFIEDPRAYVPGNKMAFPGLKDEADRENLVAYLLTFSPDYVPGEDAAATAEEQTEAQ